ncbi:MAG: AAA family ATPase, partial [Flavobacteriaceae bacterium]
QLAAHYKVPLVAEYAREFLQAKYDATKEICTFEDLIPIAKGQMELENQAAIKAKNSAVPLIICDTDLLETQVYSEIYFNDKVDPILAKAARSNQYDLYLLTYIDTPWEPDDLRDKPHEREALFERFKVKLQNNSLPFSTLKGDKTVRFHQAIGEIDTLLKTHAARR